ncbi:hypothetical protein M427DRAFT_133305 [Gonapodya prolifera JEL478]|uniref:G-protein coupled receptors family 1 profile domain-containing protein n=1 Tax=Gonapodya prolifera (strain JEL478) TaxID=1344416 RepID=A0A139AM50_GONPJ|nr:hypothetical protein M427DRAFT_133305 [Gonapodya prolifera JEL478]|eukprot:KXS17831.1 hypothetical protein M427DRAFT_133305 [Gonapodya prolifera JEL478]
MDRRANVGYLAIPVSLSVLADLSVVVFYAVAAGMGIRYLRSALHRLVAAVFIFNAMALSAWLLEKYSVCRVDLFFQVGGFSGEYYSVLLVCVLLFRSLVLNKDQLSPTRESIVLALTFAFFVSGGVAGMLTGGDICATTTTSSLGSSGRLTFGLVLGIGLGLALVLSIILVAAILISRTTRKSMDVPDTLRVPHEGSFVVGATAREDAKLLSVRLVMYPVIMLVTGGLAVVTSPVTTSVVPFIGAIALTLSGLLNALAFFTLDPAARKVSRAMLQLLSDEDGGRSRPLSPLSPVPRPTTAELQYKRISTGTIEMGRVPSTGGTVSPNATLRHDRALSMVSTTTDLQQQRVQGSVAATFVAKRTAWFLRWVAKRE